MLYVYSMSISYNSYLVFAIPLDLNEDYYELFAENEVLEYIEFGDLMGGDYKGFACFKDFITSFDKYCGEAPIVDIEKEATPEQRVIDKAADFFYDNDLTWSKPRWFFATSIS